MEGTDATVFLDKDYAEFAKKQNAIVQATLHGISMEGGSALLHPLRKDEDQCPDKEVVYPQSYPDHTVLDFCSRTELRW